MKRIYVIASSAAVIVAALLLVTVYQNQDADTTTPRRTVPLILGDVDFTLDATTKDTLGVDTQSTFALTASAPVPAELIEGNLVIEPTIEYKLESSDNNTFTIVPTTALVDNTIYTFNITAQQDESEQIREYQWAFQTKDTFKVMNTLPRDTATDVPLNSGIEIRFSHENFTALDDYFSITPAVTGHFERYRKTAVFVPDGLAEGTVYTVRLREGLPLDGTDQTLTTEYAFQFETAATSSSYSYFDVTKKFFEYPADESPVMSVRNYNGTPATVSVSVRSFDSFADFEEAVRRLNLAPYWARFAHRRVAFPADSLTEQMSFTADIQSDDYGRQYIEFPESVPAGYYLIDIPVDDYHAQAFLQIGSLAASFQSSTVSSFIWLHDIGTDQPVSGAAVSFSEDDTVSATTNTDGLAVFDTPAAIIQDNKGRLPGTYYFTVSAGGQELLVPVTDYYEWGWASAPRDYWAYLYTNRTLYSPDDSVKFWGVLTARSGVGDVQEVEVQFIKTANYVTQNEDEVIAKQTLPVSSFGTYQGSIDYTHLNPGGYRLQVMVDGTRVMSAYVSVQTYTKPAYKIEVTSRQKAIFQGDNAVFDITTEFFDGTPVGNLELEYTGALGQGVVTTDENGLATVTLGTSYDHGTYYPSYEYFSVHPTNPELTDIYTDAYIYAFGPQYTIEATATVEGSISGTLRTIDLSSINASGDEYVWDYEGDPVANEIVTMTITHEYYTKTETGTRYDYISKKTHKTYNYESHSDEVESLTVTTGADGTFSGNFTPQDDWNYKVEIKSVDPDGRAATVNRYLYRSSGYNYYWGEGYVQYHLESTTDGTGNPSYQAGDSVELSLYRNDEQLENQDMKRVLYFKGQRGLFDVTPSAEASLSFTMQDSYAPNIYVYAVFFDGRSYYLTPSKTIDFDQNDKALQISINQDKDAYRPGDTVRLDIAVTDTSDSPVRAEVNVSAIDEALAAIQWANSNDILADLYENIPRPLNYSYLSHEQAITPVAEGGGCFAGDTQILMADGSTKSIADVSIGDYVMTYASPEDHTLIPALVYNTLEHTVGDYVVINGVLSITPEHVVWLNDAWQPVGNARPGDHMIDTSGRQVQVSTVEAHHELLTVYNLHVAEQHTFFADNLYVHNEKAGGRQNFQDVAVFESVTTDRGGHAQVSFKLPDNVTAWQTTVHAITTDLRAGATQTGLISTLPFFVDVAVASDYIVGDHPQVLIRSYGRDRGDETVRYTVTFPEFSDDEIVLTGAPAETVQVDLPDFPAGQHQIRVAATQGSREDAVIQKFTYHDSNSTQGTANYYRLEEGMQIGGSSDGRTSLVFTNLERGQYYNDLRWMIWESGDRVEQVIGRWGAQQLLAEYFDVTEQAQSITFTDYQVPEGGIALLPYSSAELLLTAKAFLVAPGLFDTISAQEYFESVLNNTDSNTDEVVYALLGMAALDRPVLTDINLFLAHHELGPDMKLYLTRAIAHLGATEYAASLLQDILDEYGNAIDPYIRVEIGNTQDEYTEFTYQAAIVAAAVSSDKASQLYTYAMDNRAQYDLNTLDQLAYIQTALPLLSADPVSFTYILDGQSQSVSLTNEDTYRLSVTPAQLSAISFGAIEGAVGLISSYEIPVDPATVATDANLNIARRYEVNGQRTTTFHANDIVKVILSPTIRSAAIDTEYQVTDYLPAGLKLLTNLASRNLPYDQLLQYPYEHSGQAVKFWSGKPNSKEFFYYAIVTGRGSYIAESPKVQGFVATNSVNYGTRQEVTIE